MWKQKGLFSVDISIRTLKDLLNAFQESIFGGFELKDYMKRYYAG